MKVSADKVVQGIINYADGEVLNNLPTMGKWVLGTGIGIATTKLNEMIYALNSNELVKMMGIVDEDGMYDIDLIIDSMKASAQKYGKMDVNIPMIGRLTFSESDIDALRNYIER